MASDAVAAMVPFIREVFSAEAEFCASFEVEGNADAWLQVMRGTLNFAYPLSSDPKLVIESIVQALPGAEVADWEAGKFATVTFDPARPQLVAITADRVLTELFRLGDYDVGAAIEEMG